MKFYVLVYFIKQYIYIYIYILTLPRWQMQKIGKLTLHYSWIVKIGTYITDVFSVIWKSKAIQDSLPTKKIKYI